MKKFVPLNSAHTQKEVLNYLSDSNIAVSLEMPQSFYKELYFLPAELNIFRADISSLENAEQPFRLKVQPVGCEKNKYDSFLFAYDPNSKSKSYSLCTNDVGISADCKMCERFLDVDGNCGKYSKRKAELIEDVVPEDPSSRIVRFQKEVRTGRIQMPTTLVVDWEAIDR